MVFRQPSPSNLPGSIHFVVRKTYPHDSAAYTQGLIYRDGYLFERYRVEWSIDPAKSQARNRRSRPACCLERTDFAEGLEEWNGQLVQLTWQSNIAFVYDLASFAPRRTLAYTGEGWGLTRDCSGFILSDGSERLRFLHPDTFREVRRVTVTDRAVPLSET